MLYKFRSRSFLILLLIAVNVIWLLSLTNGRGAPRTVDNSEERTRLSSRDKTLMVDDTISVDMGKKVRVFCWILSQEKQLKNKLAAVNETWAKRCDGKIFIMTTKLQMVGVVDFNISDGRQHLAEKTYAAIEYLYQRELNNYDWFLKADDDVYIVMENLKYLLSHYNPKEPVYLGHLFKRYSKWGYMSGGAGYVLSREAVRMMVEKGYRVKGKCRKQGPFEDVEISRCIHAVGITVHDTRDRYGRASFHPESVFDHIAGPIPLPLFDQDRHTPVKGDGCCSELVISFHRCSPKWIRTLDHLLYRTTVYGKRPHMKGFKNFFKIGTVPPLTKPTAKHTGRKNAASASKKKVPK